MVLTHTQNVLSFQGSVAKKPYNPIIGETFHCSWKIPEQGDEETTDSDTTASNGHPEGKEKQAQLIYSAEQVSHHPPGGWACVCVCTLLLLCVLLLYFSGF